MITKAPTHKPELTPFQRNLIISLQRYWLMAQGFHKNPSSNINSPAGKELMEAERAILRTLGLPENAVKFTDPIQRLGFEDHFYPEIVQQCVIHLTRMAEDFLLSAALTPKQLLQQALAEKTPITDLLAELQQPHTVYTAFLYYEYFLTEQISVPAFWNYLQFLKDYKTPAGREIPYDVNGLSNRRWLNAMLNDELLFFPVYVEYLRYLSRTDPWQDNPEILIEGVDCTFNTNLIIDCIYIARIDSKFSANNVWLEAVLSMHDGFHAVSIGCSMNMFHNLMSGSKYKQQAAQVNEYIQLARNRGDRAISLDLNEFLHRNLEISGCVLELAGRHYNNQKKGGANICQFDLVDVDLRSNSSSLIDE